MNPYTILAGMVIIGLTILTTSAAVSYNLGPKPVVATFSCEKVAP